MRPRVVHERHCAICRDHAIDRDLYDAPRDVLGIPDLDRIRARAEPIVEGESVPVRGDTRIEANGATALFETQEPLEDHAVAPARRAGVPGPSAASFATTYGIHVGRDDVG